MLRDFHAFQLAKKIHWACKTLKVSRLLRDQLLRASSSYGIALGSLRECEAILELEQIQDESLLGLMDQLGAILYTLTREPTSRARPADNRHRTATATETGTDPDLT